MPASAAAAGALPLPVPPAGAGSRLCVHASADCGTPRCSNVRWCSPRSAATPVWRCALGLHRHERLPACAAAEAQAEGRLGRPAGLRRQAQAWGPLGESAGLEKQAQCGRQVE